MLAALAHPDHLLLVGSWGFAYLLRCWLRFHPNHLLLVGSRGLAYLLPSRNLKCFGYRSVAHHKY
ncbi:MAG: hypothetical protein QS721_05380 [Candidatus Endonucleobacter sp. (ex Gigantidas childressi)]|nr:hypothetical protein [Candidatus Endonucleobacter sp. (ex Gigantidas childressi)]